MRQEYLSLSEAERVCGIPARTLRRWAELDGAPPRGARRHGRLDVRQLRKALASRGLPVPPRVEGGPRVLIADDDTDLLVLTAGELRRVWPRCHIRGATDGRAAQRKLLQWPPDILITDLKMPGMDGICLSQFLHGRREFERTRVLAITAFDDPETRDNFFESGADELLHKPFEPRELVESVMRLIGPPPALAEGDPE